MSTLRTATERRNRAPAGESPAVMARFDEHRHLAERLTSRYARSPHHADLRQVADIALLTAARRFDPERGAFERYAVVTIAGELKKYLRQNGWSVHVPRRAQEDALTVQSTVDRLTVEFGRSPRLSEVVDRSGLSSERVTGAISARAARFARGDEAIEHIGDGHQADRTLTTMAVRDALRSLPEPDRDLLSMAFDRNLTQREIAVRIGISQSQVQRRLARVLDALKPELEDRLAVDAA